MASPVEAASATTSIATAIDPWATVNLPAGITSGMLLLAFARTGAAATFTTFTGFTALDNNNGADPTAQITYVGYRWTDGTEGASISVDMSVAAKGSVIIWRITGAINPATQPPEIGTAVTGAGGAGNPNPPNRTVTGGPKDILAFALCGIDGEPPSQDITAVPASYGTEVTENSGTAGAAGSNNVISGASRQLSAVSAEDPGTFTATANSGFYTNTVVIHPAAAAAASLVPRRRLDPNIRR